MFLLKRLSDVCGWPATTYASLYYHGNWGDVCKRRAVSWEKRARCVIAAMPGDSLLIRLCGDKEALSDSSVFCSSDRDLRLVLPLFPC